MPRDVEKPIDLITSDEAAKLLRISRPTFYRFLSSGILGPIPIRLGGRNLWKPDEFREWVASGCPCRQKWQKIKQNPKKNR